MSSVAQLTCKQLWHWADIGPMHESNKPHVEPHGAAAHWLSSWKYPVPGLTDEHGANPLSSHDEHEPEHCPPAQAPDEEALLDDELLDEALLLDDELLDDELLDDELLEALEAPSVPPPTPPVPFAPPLPVEPPAPPAPCEPPAPAAEDVLDPLAEEEEEDAGPFDAELSHASWPAIAPAQTSAVNSGWPVLRTLTPCCTVGPSRQYATDQGLSRRSRGRASVHRGPVRGEVSPDRARQIRERRVVDERVERRRSHGLSAVRRKKATERAKADEVDEPLLLLVAEAEAPHDWSLDPDVHHLVDGVLKRVDAEGTVRCGEDRDDALVGVVRTPRPVEREHELVVRPPLETPPTFPRRECVEDGAAAIGNLRKRTEPRVERVRVVHLGNEDTACFFAICARRSARGQVLEQRVRG